MVLTQLVLFHQFKSTKSASNIALPGCQDSCGENLIPCPFGLGLNCSRSDDFNVTCDRTHNNGTPTPYLTSYFRILNISLSLGQVRVGGIAFSQCYNTTTNKEELTNWEYYFHEKFWLNTEKNKFTVIGCNTLAYLLLDSRYNSTVECVSSCDSLEILSKYGSCSGIGCCQTALPTETSHIKVWFQERNNLPEVFNFSRCTYAMVVEESAFMFETSYITTDKLSAYVATNVTQLPLYESQSLPVLVNWVIENTTCDSA
ncbi:wall-associated receptor kinase 2-like [Carex rostrata]